MYNYKAQTNRLVYSENTSGNIIILYILDTLHITH